MSNAGLMKLLRAIAAGDAAAVRLIDASPKLATAGVASGAECFLDAVRHQVYAGDTALHVAAAAHRRDVAQALIARGAAIGALNRRGATPLHYAADGSPGCRASIRRRRRTLSPA